jgi:protein-disulfide isomerase-like protein with CxxC motif
MSYTEGSEQEMGLTRLADESSEDYMERLQKAGKTFGATTSEKEYVIDLATNMGMKMFQILNKVETLKKTLKEQMDFAEGRLIEATNQQVQDEIYKWSGYIQALRFIQSEL